ncbi:insulinase family protein [Rapidithrix thailandica]|uniref:Insulinase family protein n=1 Tax=Rapidithrix thailandica TaxID=413964 RepID=A0AAW9S2N6_9BACT
MHTSRTFLALIFLVLGQSIAFAQALKTDPNLTKGQFKNGLTYYIYPHAYPEGQVNLRLYVKAGSLQETEQQRGLAHFVEHMAFNGTKNFEKNELISFLESKGVKFGHDLNAHTSFDETVYKLQLPANTLQELDEALTVLSDWAFAISFDSLQIEKERGVIMEEWRTGLGARGRMRKAFLSSLLNESRFVERLPIGDTAVIQHFNHQEIKDFYHSWYRPELMAVAITGDIDAKKVKKLIKKHFRKQKNQERAWPESYPVPEHKDTLVNIVTDPEATDVEMSLYKKTKAFDPIQTEESYNQYLTRSMVNRLMSHRFSQISLKNPAYRKAGLSIGNLVSTKGAFGGDISLYKEKIEKGILQYMREKERMMRYGFTNSELNIVKKNYLLKLEQALKGKEGKASGAFLGDIENHFYKGHAMVSKEEELKLARKHLSDIDSVALLQYLQTFDQKEDVVVIVTAPEEIKDKLPTEKALLALLQTTKAEALEPWSVHTVVPGQLLAEEPMAGRIVKENSLEVIGAKEWVLSNQARVIFKPTDLDPNRVNMSGFREGGLYALDSAEYVTGMFAKSVIGMSGAGNFSRQALSEYLAGNTASAILILAKNREGVVAGADLTDLEEMFRLMYLKWTAPRVDSTMFVATQERTLEAIANARKKPDYSYNRQLGLLLNGRSYVTEGLDSARLEKELVLDKIIPVFQKRFGSAQGFTFVITGQVEEAVLKPLVERYLAALPSENIRKDYVYQGPALNPEKKELVDYAGQSPKAKVNIFFRETDFEYDYAYTLKLEMLEEVLKIKLRHQLREESSGVYGVGVSLSATSKPNKLMQGRVVYTCSPDNVDRLQKEVFQELDKICKDPASFESELVNIKTQMLEARRVKQQSNTFWNSGIRNHYYHGFTDWGYFTNYAAMVNAIDAGMLSRMLQRQLEQENIIKATLLPIKN